MFVQDFLGYSWPAFYVVQRKKEILKKIQQAFRNISFEFLVEYVDNRLRTKQSLKIIYSVPESDTVKDLFDPVLFATRIFYLDEVELYFVGDEDYGPFSPINELESLYSIFKKVKSVIPTANDVQKIDLQQLLKLVDRSIATRNFPEHNPEGFRHQIADDDQEEDPQQLFMMFHRSLDAREFSEHDKESFVYKDYRIADAGLKWGQLNEMQTKLELADFQGAKGFKASDDIKTGEVVLSIPLDKLITKDVVFGSSMSKKMETACKPWDVLVLLCIKERYYPNRTESCHHEYFCSLPDRFHTGLTFNKEVVDALYWTGAERKIRQNLKMLRNQFNRLEVKLKDHLDIFPEGGFTWERFLWAWEVIFCNNIELCSEGEPDTCSKPLSDGWNRDYLIPVVGCFNRSLRPHILRCEKFVEGNTPSLQFIAVRPCKKGEQCYLSCENVSGTDLVTFYGFVPEEYNHHDVIGAGFDDEPDLGEWPPARHMLRDAHFLKGQLPMHLKDFLRLYYAHDDENIPPEIDYNEVLPDLEDGLELKSIQLLKDASRLASETDLDSRLALKYIRKTRMMIVSILSVFHGLTKEWGYSSSTDSMESLKQPHDV